MTIIWESHSTGFLLSLDYPYLLQLSHLLFFALWLLELDKEDEVEQGCLNKRGL